MDNETPSGFGQGFLDDFFAESDEHLAAIRRNLLVLEAALPDGPVRLPAIEEMLHSIHSLKGISGMVGLGTAEAVAHEMESYLRALRDGRMGLSLPGFEVLLDAARTLESAVVALREKTAQPDIAPVLGALRAQLAAASAPVVGPLAQETAASAGDADAALGTWRVTFVPSNELQQRGVNVNAVRERLRQLGEIVEARPTIPPSGGIAFEFTVRTAADPAVFEAWRADGISAERVEAVPPPEALPRRAEADKPKAAAAAPGSVPSRLVRVDLGRLDDVMRLVADIVVTRGRMAQAVERTEPHLPQAELRALQENNQLLERQIRALRDAVMRVRLVPVREIFGRMPFVVRDLARDNGKQVRLVLRGQETEIDKFLIERMMDPILHLVRNAVAHGIETPTDRVRRGKPATGVIGLHAATLGDSVVIEVEDDGAGVDVDAVLRRAHGAGLPEPARGDLVGVLDLLCAPGLSTREEADRGSGRGVGMDVVKSTVGQLSGTIEMDTREGQGTRFIITLPLTLAIVDALLCVVGLQRFAVPQNAVREVLELRVADIRPIENNEVFPYRGSALPLVRLSSLMDLEAAPGDRLHVFVVGTGRQAAGLAVDRIVSQREIVVRAVADPLLHVEGVAGATELGDGKPILILDPVALVRSAMTRREECRDR